MTSVKMSFEKAFINIGNFPHEIGKTLFHIGTGAEIWPKKHSRKITASILTPFREPVQYIAIGSLDLFTGLR
jgi:hypothetical protein